MPTRPPVLPEDIEHLLDYIRKGRLFALQDWLNAGNPLRAPGGAGPGANAITTGFHSIVEVLLRAGGWSTTELADGLDLARSQKRDDIADLILHYSTQPPSHGLPPRAQRCLSAAGIPIEKQAVLHALRTGALSWQTTLYGKYTHRDVCRWLGVEETFPATIYPEDTRPPFVENGLSYRAKLFSTAPGFPLRNTPSGTRSRPARLSPANVPTTTATKRTRNSAAG